MKNLLRKCAGLFLILFLPVGFVSCVQYEQSSSFFPDGSGKISMSIAIKKSMIEQLEEMAKAMGSEEEMDPLADFTDPKKLAENSEGILAWTKPEVVDDGKWIRVSYTGYFVDINKVKIYQEQEKGGETTKSLAFACKYEKGDETSTLQLIDDTREKLGEDLKQPEEDDAMREMQIQMMKTMMEGMKIRMAITVPGEILESSGFMSTEGRTCSIEMDDKMMIAMMEELRRSLMRNAREVIDDVILNGDTTVTNNINADGATIANTDAGKGQWLLGFDGLLHLPLVDNTSQATDHNAAVSDDMFNEVRSKLGKYGVRPSETVYVTDVNTFIRALSVSNFRTLDKFGPQATLLTGQLGAVEGIPVIVSEQMALADTDGKVTDAGSGTNTGRLLIVNRSQWRVGFKRELTIETVRDAQKRQNIMVVSFRIGLQERTGSRSTATHTALHYDITGV